MARHVSYHYKGKAKKIPFSYSLYKDIFEAAASAENIDLTQYWAMEKQVIASTREKQAIKSFRDQEFKRMGLTEIRMIKDEDDD